jgi:hypothetical protein
MMVILELRDLNLCCPHFDHFSSRKAAKKSKKCDVFFFNNMVKLASPITTDGNF